MTIIAIWGRAKKDNIIGVNNQIPWYKSSDLRRFRRLTEGKILVVGRKTYETFPNRTLPNRKIFVLTRKIDYEVSDKENHKVIPDISNLIDVKEDIYIAGGSEIYKIFLKNDRFKPDYIVDSLIDEKVDVNIDDEIVSINQSVEIMNKDYLQTSKEFVEDGVITTIWAKKGLGVLKEQLFPELLSKIEVE